MDPGQLMVSIEADARALDIAGKQLADAIRWLAQKEQAYELELETAKITLFHESKESGERLPAEDLRTALAHRTVDREVYGEYLTAKADVDALRAVVRSKEGTLSAKQSLLNAYRAEMGVAA